MKKLLKKISVISIFTAIIHIPIHPRLLHDPNILLRPAPIKASEDDIRYASTILKMLDDKKQANTNNNNHANLTESSYQKFSPFLIPFIYREETREAKETRLDNMIQIGNQKAMEMGIHRENLSFDNVYQHIQENCGTFFIEEMDQYLTYCNAHNFETILKNAYQQGIDYKRN